MNVNKSKITSSKMIHRETLWQSKHLCFPRWYNRFHPNWGFNEANQIWLILTDAVNHMGLTQNEGLNGMNQIGFILRDLISESNRFHSNQRTWFYESNRFHPDRDLKISELNVSSWQTFDAVNQVKWLFSALGMDRGWCKARLRFRNTKNSLYFSLGHPGQTLVWLTKGELTMVSTVVKPVENSSYCEIAKDIQHPEVTCKQWYIQMVNQTIQHISLFDL